MATDIRYIRYNGIIVPSSTHALYNGVKLPIIPADILADYPYAWIRNNTQTGYYDLILATGNWFLSSTDTLNHNDSNACKWYRVATATAESATAWTYTTDTTSSGWGCESGRDLVWSNHDIPNGSATATDIYFEGTEVVPVGSDVIGSLKSGQTATLACAGKKAVGNIVVAVGSGSGGVSITYNGSATEVEAGKTATLQCAGKKMTNDVYVAVEAADDSIVGTWVFNDTIHTIDGSSYYFKLKGQIYNSSYSITFNGENGYSQFESSIDGIKIGQNVSAYPMVRHNTPESQFSANPGWYYRATGSDSWHKTTAFYLTIEKYVGGVGGADESILLTWLKANATKTA